MEMDRHSGLNARRPDLLRFAGLQLRDAGVVAFAARGTLLVAPSSCHRRESPSSYKTRLISIIFRRRVPLCTSCHDYHRRVGVSGAACRRFGGGDLP
ncbi:MAG: hypothetical protein Q8J99_17170 [Sulfuritalea sp.]|nr:hypothetical protein [Sulfuritalea sp.]